MPAETLDERFFAESESRTGMRQHDNFIRIWVWFQERGIPEQIFENRAWPWLTDIDADNFLARIDFLLLNGTRDQWDHAFYLWHALSNREWMQILEIQTWLRLNAVHWLQEATAQLSAKNERNSDIIWWLVLATVAAVLMHLYGNHQNTKLELLPPAQLQTLTKEQIIILRQQMEAFLRQNQELESPAAE